MHTINKACSKYEDNVDNNIMHTHRIHASHRMHASHICMHINWRKNPQLCDKCPTHYMREL